MPASVREEQYKLLTIRLVPDDMQRLKEAAEYLGVGPTVLARMLIRQGLQGQEGESRFPFAALHPLLAPLASEKGLTDKKLVRRIKQVRRKRWEEQYKKPVEEVRKRQARAR
ncbi:MAG: hypothetical protein HYZ72_11360 [Deltaproteobacteria bacterium]|nr:hypothetical protein [Deltaproteobacteria bacterium]